MSFFSPQHFFLFVVCYKCPGAIRNGFIHRCSSIINGDTKFSDLSCSQKLFSPFIYSKIFSPRSIGAARPEVIRVISAQILKATLDSR